MSKYTKQDVIEQRKCGVKYWDEAIKLVGRDKLFERALAIRNQFPDIWGPGWPNLSWAFGNAVIEIVNRGQISQNWNLDEVLTPEEMEKFKIEFNMGEYTPLWNRKVLKVKTPKQ